MTSQAVLDAPPQSVSAFPAGIDPVRFEVLRNALLAITEEMGATLRQAAYSTNIKTRGDFSCAFFDRELRTIAQAFAQPSHLGSLAHIVPRAIQTYGAEHLQPGDGILINDPYLGGVHLNDITLITPVFYRHDLVGYVANIAHHVDVGGGAPGSIGVSSEIYQEGMVIPPVRFVKGGEIDRDLFAMIRSNFRGTREISGDFRAQTAANRLGVQRLEALLERYGTAELQQYLEALLDYTERRTAAAFAQFPDGSFTAESCMDGDGVRDEPVKLAVTVHINQGRISVDLTGCNAQRPSPTNATFSQTYSGVVYVLKCLSDPDIPVNDGFYRLVDIRTRPGSVVSARHPAAVAAGWEVAMQLCDLLFKALSEALPDRVLAGTKGCICNIAFGGISPVTDEYFPSFGTRAERRVALVIGNSAYQYTSPLKNPVNDAQDIARVLQELQFQVILKTDANLDAMADVIFRFGESLKGGGVGLFYYSDHGMQVKGENYLIPIDANLLREDDIKRKTINANDVLEKMGEAKSHLNLVFLDACRNNPFPRSVRAVSGGLAGMNAPTGTLLVFATNPNNVASDGTGRNGVYTKHLLQYIKQPSLEVGIMLRKIRTAVKEETGGQQIPWENGSIEGEFYFN